MGEIVLHAGMPKAGSSGIQQWLARSQNWLRNQGVTVAKATYDAETGIGVDERQAGRVNSGRALRMYRKARAPEPFLTQLLHGLDRLASQRARIVLSTEGFAMHFARGDELLVRGLNELGQSHRVRVAYYVRPQDSALEAAWRQWGFRTGIAPSEFVDRRLSLLDYRGTLVWVNDCAPHIDFVPRPFRRDLLIGRDVVTDFAKSFLDLDIQIAAAETTANPGLPLDVVNALRDVPKGVLWSSAHDNRVLDLIKDLLNESPESAAAEASRQLLRAYCLEVFEEDNQALARTMGWESGGLIEPQRTEVEHRSANARDGIARLDEFWAPRWSPAISKLIQEALLRLAVHEDPSFDARIAQR